jgi:ATP/maltotriose-dependent transcriptional regulator MalT
VQPHDLEVQMKPVIRRSLLALTFACSPLALHASEGSSPTDLPAYRSAVMTDTTSDGVLQRADSLRGKMRFAAARRLYMAAAQRQDAEQTKPCRVLWQVAELYFAEGDVRRAATTLDLVAAKAASYGDPEVQARALLESAILYERLGDKDQASTRLQRLDAVLTSPHISADVRSAITARRT